MSACERAKMQNKMDSDVKIKLYHVVFSVLKLPLLAWDLRDCRGSISAEIFSLWLTYLCYYAHTREMNIDCASILNKYYKHKFYVK